MDNMAKVLAEGGAAESAYSVGSQATATLTRAASGEVRRCMGERNTGDTSAMDTPGDKASRALATKARKHLHLWNSKEPQRRADLNTRTDAMVALNSFLGLPTELRLQIYGYLFGEEKSTCRMCTRTSIYVPFPDVARLRCGCVAMHPQILTVCREIFGEAMPALYEKLQLRTVLPNVNSTVHVPFVSNNILLALRRLPEYGLPHIRQIVLLDCDQSYRDSLGRSAIWSHRGNVAGAYKHAYDSVGVKMEAIWLRMHTDLPKLKHIRLDLGIPLWVNSETDVSGLAGMIQGANIEKIEVNFTAATLAKLLNAVRLGEDVKAQLEAQAAMIGRPIQISTRFRDMESEHKKSKERARSAPQDES